VENLVRSHFWRDHPTLVTGATGLLGGWLVKSLLDAQAEVVCLVRDELPQRGQSNAVFAGAVVVRGDVCDQALVERVLGEYRVETVFHLAAQTIVEVANRNPISTFDSNIRGTWVMLEACRRSPALERVLVASSDKAYGAHEELPYVEEMPLRGRHPYDVSKSCADLIAQSYAATYGLPVVVTRCGNLFGGGDLNWNRIVPGTIRSVLRGQRPVIRSDGSYVRDYLYVEDCVSAYMLLAERMDAGAQVRGEAFNFSNESQAPVLELVRRILRLMDSDLEPDVRNAASNEIRRQYLSAGKARRLLNWEPLHTLDEGLCKTISWYREFLAHAT
jgi:CDP-glucose 4,6-dehydratase